MLVGYMRVSSAHDRQTVYLQRDALIAAGVDHRNFHPDQASGARDDESVPRLFESGRHADRVEVRPARTLTAALQKIVTDLKARGIAFRSLTEQVDTTTPYGELLFSLFGALAQYERALISSDCPPTS